MPNREADSPDTKNTRWRDLMHLRLQTRRNMNWICLPRTVTGVMENWLIRERLNQKMNLMLK